MLLYATNGSRRLSRFFRRALAIDEVMIDTNDLVQFLKDANRLSVGKPVMRQALLTDEGSLVLGNPNVARDLSNLAKLLQDTNRLSEAEPFFRRALAITEKELWPGSSQSGNLPQKPEISAFRFRGLGRILRW